MRHIVIALPAYNEEPNITPLLEQFKALEMQYRSRFSLRVIVVDDASTDNTAARTAEFAEVLPLDIIRHEANQGLAGVICTVLAAFERLARSETPPAVFGLMDGDNSHDPAYIPAMLEKLDSGFDVVIASRFRRGSKVLGLSPRRKLYSAAMALLYCVLWRIPGVRDYSCGYRLYSADVIRRLHERFGNGVIESRSFAAMTELLLKCHSVGARCAEVPFALHYERKQGASKMNVARTIRESLMLLAQRR